MITICTSQDDQEDQMIGCKEKRFINCEMQSHIQIHKKILLKIPHLTDLINMLDSFLFLSAPVTENIATKFPTKGSLQEVDGT